MSAERSRERKFFAFRLPPEERRRAAALIAAIRGDSTPRAHADALSDLIVDLTETGMNAYYLRPLERVGVGPIMLNAARIGVGAAEKTLPPLVRRIVAGLTDAQLKEIAEIIDEMMV